MMSPTARDRITRLSVASVDNQASVTSYCTAISDVDPIFPEHRLRPYNITVALLPIDGRGNFEIAQAAQLAEEIRARWLVPMHYGAFGGGAVIVNRFVTHMLGFRPSIGFKVFECGERWVIPDVTP